MPGSKTGASVLSFRPAERLGEVWAVRTHRGSEEVLEHVWVDYHELSAIRRPFRYLLAIVEVWLPSLIFEHRAVKDLCHRVRAEVPERVWVRMHRIKTGESADRWEY